MRCQFYEKSRLTCMLLTLCIVFSAALAWGQIDEAEICDVNADGFIDSTDVRAILSSRNQQSSGMDDPRDADGNGQITVLDAKICIRQCSLPRCQSPFTIVGFSEVDLDGLRADVRSMETNEGNLLADSLLWQATQLAGAFSQPTPDVALQNGGGIRNNSVIPPGDITLLDTFAIAPFPNDVTIVPDIPRGQFKEILENAVACTQAADFCGSGRFAQVSGFSFVWTTLGTAMVIDADGNVVMPGTRILDVVLDDGTVIVSSGVVVPGPDLNIATIDFLANGGDQYPYRGAPFTELGVTYQEALRNYIQNGLGGVISAADYPEGGEGRITATATATTLCFSDADCPVNTICDNGRCELFEVCSSDADCPANTICDNGRCELFEVCSSDADCPVNTICDNGRCELFESNP